VMLLRRAMWSKTEEEDIYMVIIKLKKRAEEGSTSNKNGRRNEGQYVGAPNGWRKKNRRDVGCIVHMI
jgi:hypothetical protein